jgi:hypothetical protein
MVPHNRRGEDPDAPACKGAQWFRMRDARRRSAHTGVREASAGEAQWFRMRDARRRSAHTGVREASAGVASLGKGLAGEAPVEEASAGKGGVNGSA